MSFLTNSIIRFREFPDILKHNNYNWSNAGGKMCNQITFQGYLLKKGSREYQIVSAEV